MDPLGATVSEIKQKNQSKLVTNKCYFTSPSLSISRLLYRNVLHTFDTLLPPIPSLTLLPLPHRSPSPCHPSSLAFLATLPCVPFSPPVQFHITHIPPYDLFLLPHIPLPV